MQVCVTGGTGFVGSYVVRALLDDGHMVRVLHRITSKRDALTGLEYESVIGDVTDSASLQAAFAGCDWVFHVAAVADYWRSNTDKLFAVNVDGTRNVLNAAQAVGVQRVIFTSSAAAIGIPDDKSLADETTPFNLSPEQFPYGYSKFLAERAVGEAVANGLDVVTVNPTVVIGAGDLNVISGSFIIRTFQLGRFLPITFGGVAVIDVRDVAASHLAAAKQGRPGERYILSTANYTYHEWFSLIAEVIGKPKPFLRVPNLALGSVAAFASNLRRVGVSLPVDAAQVKLGARRVFFDASKAHRELHQPQIDMRRSIRETYEWYRANGYLS